MKATNGLIFLLLFIPSLIFAGEISGTINKDGRPISKLKVQIKQNEKLFGEVFTDDTGFFSITLEEEGNFKLVVIIESETAVFDVVSSDSSNDYNFTLIKTDGKWQLKKK